MTTKSEDIVGETWDYCIADSLIKTGSGLLAGTVLSLVLFKRRKWPIVFGMGAGFGMGLANCQHAFRDPHLTKMLNYKEPNMKTLKFLSALDLHSVKIKHWLKQKEEQSEKKQS